MEIITQIKEYLEDINFPTTKQELIEFMKMKEARSEIMHTIETLPDKTYETIEDISDYLSESITKITK